MNKQFTTGITYFLQEGRENLAECLRSAFSAAKNHHIKKLVIFTAQGLGVTMALDEFCSQQEFSHIKLVAVTFPIGQPFTDVDGKPIRIDISQELRERFSNQSVPIVRARMPFDPIAPPHQHRGILGQDLSLVESALNVFGGSMSLCIQAALIACDAGEVGWGEHVIALTSDTAILVQAAPTRHMLTAFAVREILCKPAVYTIGRNEQAKNLIPALQQSDPVRELEAEIIPPDKS